MARKAAAPATKATARKSDAVDPKHRWDRPLQAPGRMQVDFEERVDFRRLHDYRLARTRATRSRSRAWARCCSSTSTTSATSRAP